MGNFTFPVKYTAPEPGTELEIIPTPMDGAYPEDGLGTMRGLSGWATGGHVKLSSVRNRGAIINTYADQSARSDVIMITSDVPMNSLAQYYYSLRRFKVAGAPSSPKTVISTFPLREIEKKLLDTLSATLQRDVYLFDLEYNKGLGGGSEGGMFTADQTAIFIAVRSNPAYLESPNLSHPVLARDNIAGKEFVMFTPPEIAGAYIPKFHYNEIHFSYSFFAYHQQDGIITPNSLFALQWTLYSWFGIPGAYKITDVSEGMSLKSASAYFRRGLNEARDKHARAIEQGQRIIADYQRSINTEYAKLASLRHTEIKEITEESLVKEFEKMESIPDVAVTPRLNSVSGEAQIGAMAGWEWDILRIEDHSNVIVETHPMVLRLRGGDLPVGPIRFKLNYNGSRIEAEYLWLKTGQSFLHVRDGLICAGGWVDSLYRSVTEGRIAAAVEILMEWAKSYNAGSYYNPLNSSMKLMNIIVAEGDFLLGGSGSLDDDIIEEPDIGVEVAEDYEPEEEDPNA